MIRQPAVAGMFYEADPTLLKQQIKECFQHEKGPKNFEPRGKVKAVVSPHAGYSFSGPAMAWSYKAIKKEEADVYVIIGTNHQGTKTCASTQDFETPLGIVKNDETFTEALIQKGIPEDNDIHSQEHSIEVQLPFLQHIRKDAIITPILAGYDYEKIAQKITETAKEQNKKVVMIISTDFTHYGTNYRYLPFEGNVKEKMYKLDKKAIKHICNLDKNSFEKYIQETGATICGQHAIIIGIQALKMMNAKKGEVLQYYTSADIVGDYSNAVGYASILFY